MSDSLNFRSAFHGFNREDVVHYIEYLNAKHASELSQLRAELDNARGSVAVPCPSDDSDRIIQELEQKLQEQARIMDELSSHPKNTGSASEEPHTQEEWDTNIDARMQAEFDRDAAVEAREQAEAERDAAIAARIQAEAERDAAIAAQQEAQASSEQAVIQRDIQMEELEAYRRAERTERLARARAEKIYRQAGTALTSAASQVDEAFSQIGELTGLVKQQLDNLQGAVTSSRQALTEAADTLSQIRPEDQ